jgi:hypothetical protein
MDSSKKFALILFIAVSFPMLAQSVKVSKETARIKGESVEGYAVELEGTPEDITVAYTKYIRSFAKLKMGANPITTSEVVIKGASYKSPIYALVKEKDARGVAWIGLKESEWNDDAEKVSKEFERILYNFGVKYYRDKIQAQIDESVRALQAVEKQQQRLVTENKNLNTRLENNEKEKVQLEKSLDVNKLENLNLLTKIEQNKKSQDSVTVAAEQIKKIVEMHKERQKKVE